MNLLLIYKKEETANCTSFIFQPEEEITWRAGQFLRYQIPNSNADSRGTQRYFTIASAPSEGVVRLTTRLASEKGSTFKDDLFKLDVDDEIEASGPMGAFILDDPSKQYVFIAGGIGITPFRAILIDLVSNQSPINITLLYVNRNQDIVFRKELDKLATQNPSLKIHYILEPQSIDTLTIQSLIPNFQQPTYYLSGPKPMVEGIEQTLTNLQISKEQIKTDYFPGYTRI